MLLWDLYTAKLSASKATEKFARAAENVKRKKTGKEPLLTRTERWKKKLSGVYPPFKPELKPDSFYNRVYITGTRENATARLLRNIVLLEFFGIIMYFTLAFKYAKNPGQMGTLVSIAVHFFLSLMLIFPKAMYYFMISAHRMLSSKLRHVVLMIILALAFEYPAMNALNNLHNIAEGVSCVQSDVAESMKHMNDNVAKHSQFGMQMLQSLLAKVAKPVNEFRKLLKKFDTKLSRVVDVIRRMWSNLSDISNKCKKLMKGPYITCLNIFHEGYIECAAKERMIGTSLCENILKLQKVCNMGHTASQSVCNVPESVKGAVEGGVVPITMKIGNGVLEKVKSVFKYHVSAFKWATKNGRRVKQEFKNLKTLGVRLDSGDLFQKSTLGTIKDRIKATMKGIIAAYKETIQLFAKIIHWTFVPLTLLWPFFTTALFIYRFNYREDYKNIYITNEFDKIDFDCTMRGNSTKVLPLTPMEKQVYVRRSSWKMTAREHREFILTLALTFVMALAPLIFILMDATIFWILDEVYEMARSIRIDIPAHYELKVAGNSFGARILNSLLETFAPMMNGIRKRDERWRECFKEPNPPNGEINLLMIFLFLFCLFLCRTKVWLVRQSLALADYFFPHRVRPRALMLYNKILMERKNIMSALMSKQKAILADDQLEGRDALVRRGLQSRGYILVNCLICKKTDMRVADQANTRLCVNCGAFYCIDCFCMNEYCIDCDEEMQEVDGVELYFEHMEDELEATMSGEIEELKSEPITKVQKKGSIQPIQSEEPSKEAVNPTGSLQPDQSAVPSAEAMQSHHEPGAVQGNATNPQRPVQSEPSGETVQTKPV